jgi:hypothetical protein
MAAQGPEKTQLLSIRGIANLFPARHRSLLLLGRYFERITSFNADATEKLTMIAQAMG